MHCDCCDKLLDDEEATAKFADSGNYVMMCKGCRKFLPKELKIVSRPDLAGKKNKEEDDSDLHYFEEGELDGYEEE